METMASLFQDHRRWLAQRVLQYLQPHLETDQERAAWHNAIDALTDSLLESMASPPPTAHDREAGTPFVVPVSERPLALDGPLSAYIHGMARLYAARGQSLALMMRFLKATRRSYLDLLLFSDLSRTHKHALARAIEQRFDEMEIAACEAWAPATDGQQVPICAHCKRIRTHPDRWVEVEAYFHRHLQIEFTHGICPNCAPLLDEDEEDAADA
jgi:hypothetical protein